jgi:hypothetical protein
MYELAEVIQKTATDAAALQHALVGDANAQRRAPNPAGWADGPLNGTLSLSRSLVGIRLVEAAND